MEQPDVLPLTNSRAQPWLRLPKIIDRGSLLTKSVFILSPSSERAKIKIDTAWKSGALRLHSNVREHKAAQPDPNRYLYPALRQGIPHSTPSLIIDALNRPLRPDDPFDNWDWERSRATYADRETKSFFEYLNIAGHPDDVRALGWSPDAPATKPESGALPTTRKKRKRQTLKGVELDKVVYELFGEDLPPKHMTRIEAINYVRNSEAYKKGTPWGRGKDISDSTHSIARALGFKD